MKLFVASPFTFNEFALADRLDAQLEDGRSVRHESASIPLSGLHALADGMQMIDMGLNFVGGSLQKALDIAGDLHTWVGTAFEALITDNARKLFNAD